MKKGSDLYFLYIAFIRIIENKTGYQMNFNEVKEIIDKQRNNKLQLSNSLYKEKL
jgi:hypothetical protein